MIRVFISHSYGKSTDFGKLLYQWLSGSPLGLTPWASFDVQDLPQGGDDYERIIKAAQKSDFCICVLEKDNLQHQWINFEAGLFYGKRNETYNMTPVYTILINGLNHTDLTGTITKTHPLSRIYHCIFTKKTKSLNDLLVTIHKNHSNSDAPLESVTASKMKAIADYIKSGATKTLIKEAEKLGISV